jgi:hypothetical protein
LVISKNETQIWVVSPVSRSGVSTRMLVVRYAAFLCCPGVRMSRRSRCGLGPRPWGLRLAFYCTPHATGRPLHVQATSRPAAATTSHCLRMRAGLGRRDAALRQAKLERRSFHRHPRPSARRSPSSLFPRRRSTFAAAARPGQVWAKLIRSSCPLCRIPSILHLPPVILNTAAMSPGQWTAPLPPRRGCSGWGRVALAWAPGEAALSLTFRNNWSMVSPLASLDPQPAKSGAHRLGFPPPAMLCPPKDHIAKLDLFLGCFVRDRGSFIIIWFLVRAPL